MNPVLSVRVPDTPVEGAGGEDEDEVAGQVDTQQEILVKLPGTQPVNVQENREPTQLQVNLQQTGKYKKISMF